MSRGFLNSGLNPSVFLKLIPALAELVGEVVDALRDGRVTDDEIQAIGQKLLALVQAVTGAFRGTPEPARVGPLVPGKETPSGN